jgi:hypothetical protein
MRKQPGSRKKTFDFISPEMLAMFLSEPEQQIGAPDVKHFQFVVILLDDTKPEQVPRTANAVTATLVRYRATITSVSPTLFVALLGVPSPERNSPEARRELIRALLRENGKQIRIAHGECDNPVGLFGSHGRWTYGAVLPKFPTLLSNLLQTKPGAATETI